LFAGCNDTDLSPLGESGGSPSGGSAQGAGGTANSGGSSIGGAVGTSGGRTTGGFSSESGGSSTMGGTGPAATGGTPGSGGNNPSGGVSSATGGTATGGKATGGNATGGSGNSTGGGSGVNCSATMPTGGTQHSGNGMGGAGNLAWQIWSSTGSGNMTTFSTPAFIASWNNSGDYLGRLGFEWGNSGKTYTGYGTITAQFVETKSGTAGGYSYIGIYGWSINPCIEYYIVDDSFNNMPVNPGTTTNKGTATIDGGTYTLYTRPASGANRCSGVSNWTQFYSVRQSARSCGTISVTQHFDAWASKGMTLGNLLEVKIVVEAGGGTGSVNFPIANVTTTQ
jgi:endo-1,4-beta-xylanase